MQDTYQVTLPAGGKVRVTLAGLPASCNVHVVLQRLRPEDEAPAVVLGKQEGIGPLAQGVLIK